MELFNPDLDTLRHLASLPPGPQPLRLNMVKYAESIRPRRLVVSGSDDTPHIMARTACQLVYAEGSMMIDSGMDLETHRTFGVGRDDPYFAEVYAEIQTALRQANGILLTHYHGDHVGGLVCSPFFDELAPKTMVTHETARLMVETPHKPPLVISPEAAGRFVSFDYQRYFPLAPGLVLIKAPGHTSDSQMLFIRLASGREFLHSVDSAWHMDNILFLKGKAAPWVKEDQDQLLAHYRWLKNIHESDLDVTVLVTHDNDRLQALVAAGVVGGALELGPV